jgi:hypothetical protein
MYSEALSEQVMKVEINIPETMSEVTLGQYQKFLKIQENNTDERFLQIKMIEIFCNVPSEYVLNMRLSDTNEIVSMLNELFSDKQKLIQRTKIGGKEYGFIPKLEDISLGEYIDLDTYLGNWENMHLAMQVLYRPIKNKYGERYSIDDYKASDGLHMKDITMDCVMGSILFFYRLGTDLSKAILNSSQAEKENLIVRYLNSEVSGVGINQYTHSLSVMLQDLNISLN